MSMLLLMFIPLLPLLVASGLLLSKHPLWCKAVPWAVIPSLLVLIMLEPGDEVEIPWLLLHTHLGLDGTTQLFLAFTALLWGISSIYALAYLRDDPQRQRFFIFFTLSMAGNLGLIVARDIVSFYLFFALMGFAAYGLVVHEGHQWQRRAGRVYLILVVMGEVALFAAFAIMAGKAGGVSLQALEGISLPPVVTALLILGFGIKIGAVPLHFWLPLSYSAAPTPASAVLSGAMINAGLLGWLHFLPLGGTASPGLGVGLVLIGVGSAFYGVIVGVCQLNPKTVLGYSSISQMGLISVLLGVGLMEPTAWPLLYVAVLVYATHHALVKCLLFLSVGAASNSIHQAKVIYGAVLAALALAGAPLTSGVAAKLVLKQSLHDYPFLVMVLTVAAIGTTLLMARFIYTLIRATTVRQEVNSTVLMAWLSLLAITFLYPWFWSPSQTVMIHSMELYSFANALWPIIAGVGIALIVFFVSRKRDTPVCSVAEGDVVVWVEAGLIWIGKALHRLFKNLNSKQENIRDLIICLFEKLKRLDAGAVEAIIGQWQIVGIFYLGLMCVLLLISIF